MEKKKIKLWQKILFIILAIIIIVPVIIVIVNSTIINQIIIEQKENVNEQNYSYTVQSNLSENVSTKIYYKDGIKMYVIENNDVNVITWKNQNTNEMIHLVPHTLNATVEEYDGTDSSDIPYLIDKQMSKTLILLSIITTDTIDDVECYKINHLGQVLWFNKSTGMIVKVQNGKTIKDGNEINSISEFKDWKFNELTDIDVTRPNLMGYKITNN